MELTYRKQRGYHYWVCLVCGRREREALPDQADDRYAYNPGNPWLAVCGGCNGGSPSAAIKVGNSTLPPQLQLDGEAQMPVLDGEWGEYWQIARRFEHKAPAQDREDLRHNIMIRLFEVARTKEAKGEAFTEVGKLRTASLVVWEFWHTEKRNGKVISLNTVIEDGEGDATELWETIADDRAVDLEAWVDAKVWLMGCPRRLVGIATKRASGIPLDGNAQRYLNRYQKQLKLTL